MVKEFLPLFIRLDIGDSNHLDSLKLQELVLPLIVSFGAHMGIAIQLNDQLCRRAPKVDNVRPDNLLPPPFESICPPCAEITPDAFSSRVIKFAILTGEGD